MYSIFNLNNVIYAYHEQEGWYEWDDHYDEWTAVSPTMKIIGLAHSICELEELEVPPPRECYEQ